MRSPAIIAAALAAAAAVCTPAAARERPTGEAELARLLEGREAGKPASCLPSVDTRDMRIISDTALVFGSGSTIWVNRPHHPGGLDDDDILVTYQTGSQLCRLDRVDTVSRTGHFFTGFVSLGDFVPYRRVARAD